MTLCTLVAFVPYILHSYTSWWIGQYLLVSRFVFTDPLDDPIVASTRSLNIDKIGEDLRRDASIALIGLSENISVSNIPAVTTSVPRNNVGSEEALKECTFSCCSIRVY